MNFLSHFRVLLHLCVRVLKLGWMRVLFTYVDTLTKYSKLASRVLKPRPLIYADLLIPAKLNAAA